MASPQITRTDDDPTGIRNMDPGFRQMILDTAALQIQAQQLDHAAQKLRVQAQQVEDAYWDA